MSTIIFLWRDLAVVEFMAKSRNPIARMLKYFTPKRFKDKKKYERKKYVWKRSLGKGNET